MFTPTAIPNPIENFENSLKTNQTLANFSLWLAKFSITWFLIIILLVITLVTTWTVSAVSKSIKVPANAIVDIRSPLPGSVIGEKTPISINVVTTADPRTLTSRAKLGNSESSLEVVQTGDFVVTLRGGIPNLSNTNILEIFLYSNNNNVPVLESYTKIPVNLAEK